MQDEIRVPVTYHTAAGTRCNGYVEIPPELQDKVDLMDRLECRFTVERLRGGAYSARITHATCDVIEEMIGEDDSDRILTRAFSTMLRELDEEAARDYIKNFE